MYFGVAAHSLATTARDTAGHLLPVYFPIGPAEQPLMWFQPLLAYAIALVLQVLPLNELTIRLPMALIGTANVVLAYFATRQVVQREWSAIVAAVMLALAPAHFLFARTATDYLLPVPFILGWLWCVSRYYQSGERRDLLAGSVLLGFGLYSLIASYFLMPCYALLTCVVVWSRRERLEHYALVCAGVGVPALAGLAFMLLHPEMLQTVMSRYAPGEADAGHFAATRLQNLSVYWSFWDPELLAINGRSMLTGVTGVFLLPTVGAAIVGAVRAVTERNGVALLWLAALIVTPLPASLVDEPGAIRRALAMLPFVVLLAAYGVDWIASRQAITRRVAFVTVFALLVFLCVAYRPQLPLAQAYIRAATLPLGVVAAAVLFHLTRMRHATWGWPSFAAAAIVALSFVFFYVDFLFVSRVGVIPATLIVWLYRLLCATAIVVVALMVLRPRRWQAQRGALWSAGLAGLVVGYFFIDRFTAFAPRYLHVALVATGTIVLAAKLRGAAVAPHRLMQVAIVTLLATMSLQFADFYADYRGGYPVRRAGDEGKVMRGFDRVLEDPASANVPAIYVAMPMERDDVCEIFWQFAVRKHRRHDLASQQVTASGREIEADRATLLPPRSIVLAATSPTASPVIDRLVTQGVLVREQPVVAGDGAVIAWILRRTPA